MGLTVRYPELAFLEQIYEKSPKKLKWESLSIPEGYEGAEVIYVYRFTPDIAPLIAWANQEKARDLVVIEDRIEAVSQIEEEGYASAFEGKIHFRFKLEHLSLEEFTSSLVREFPFSRVVVLGSEAFKLLLMRKSVLEEAVVAEMFHYHKLYKNLSQNFKHLERSFDVAQLKNAFHNVPAILCGAGPSLALVRDDLKKNNHKALVLAGGSAITALGSMGIDAHFIFALDPNPEEFTRLAFHVMHDVPLISAPRLQPDVFYSHTGPLGYFSTGTGGGIENFLEKELGIEDTQILLNLGEEALSVITVALMTALHFGCNPILFAGIDLAYGKGKRYAPGVISDMHCSLEQDNLRTSEATVEVEGALTATKWVMERDVIDDVIRKYPETSFFRISPPGLPFQEAPYDPDWTKRLGKERDLKGLVHNTIMKHPLKVAPGSVQKTLSQFYESLERSLEIVRTIQEELKGGKEETPRMTVFEMDLEEELSFKIALNPAVYALSIHLQREYREDAYRIKCRLYQGIEAIIQEYLTYSAGSSQ